ncbi:MAG: DUF4019 domain-containing protein [Croceibacterium sp.]
MLFIAAILVALSGATASIAGEPRIVERRVPGGYKVAIIDFVGTDQNAAQAMISAEVQRLCSPLTPQWGRFTLNAMIGAPKGKPLKAGRFEQDIQCVKPPIADVTSQTAAFTPTSADNLLVRDVALKFLGLRDAGNADASFAMLSPTMRQTTDRADWEREIRTMPEVIGNAVERTIVKVTWYIDPPGVPSGVYAAADFEGHSSRLAIHCGYVALKRQPGGEFLIVRIEEGRLRATDAKALGKDKLLEMRTTFQCRG